MPDTVTPVTVARATGLILSSPGERSRQGKLAKATGGAGLPLCLCVSGIPAEQVKLLQINRIPTGRKMASKGFL